MAPFSRNSAHVEPVARTVDDATPTQPEVTVYWRPGCSFCASLLFRLDRSNITYARRNIWDDDKARAFVRSVARGSETVPTVTVGDTFMVNPTFRQLASAVEGRAPAEGRRKRRWRT